MPVLLSSLRTPVSQAMALPEPLKSGLSPLGSPGVPWHPQILADQLTLFQLGGTDYAHLIITGTPGFSDLLTDMQLFHKSRDRYVSKGPNFETLVTSRE